MQPPGVDQSLRRPHCAGREKFLGEVHKWVDEKGGQILQQLRRLGASPDWSRQAYTMSPQLSAAVLDAFLRMHASGLIYRDNRLVNWDTRLQSAVSDIEVKSLQTPSKLPPFTEPGRKAMHTCGHPGALHAPQSALSPPRGDSMAADSLHVSEVAKGKGNCAQRTCWYTSQADDAARADRVS